MFANPSSLDLCNAFLNTIIFCVSTLLHRARSRCCGCSAQQGTGFNVLGNPFHVSIPMNVSSIFGGFSCVAEPAALSPGDRAPRSCPFLCLAIQQMVSKPPRNCHPRSRQGGKGWGGRDFSCAVLLPGVQQKDGDADCTGCFVYTMYTKHRSLLFVRQ